MHKTLCFSVKAWISHSLQLSSLHLKAGMVELGDAQRTVITVRCGISKETELTRTLQHDFI